MALSKVMKSSHLLLLDKPELTPSNSSGIHPMTFIAANPLLQESVYLLATILQYSIVMRR